MEPAAGTALGLVKGVTSVCHGHDLATHNCVYFGVAYRYN
jgi:hypothetical protein